MRPTPGRAGWCLEGWHGPPGGTLPPPRNRPSPLSSKNLFSQKQKQRTARPPSCRPTAAHAPGRGEASHWAGPRRQTGPGPGPPARGSGRRRRSQRLQRRRWVRAAEARAAGPHCLARTRERPRRGERASGRPLPPPTARQLPPRPPRSQGRARGRWCAHAWRKQLAARPVAPRLRLQWLLWPRRWRQRQGRLGRGVVACPPRAGRGEWRASDLSRRPVPKRPHK